MSNVSVGGATVQDIIDQQLPQVDLKRADLIIVATASDLEGRVPLDDYRAHLRALRWSASSEKDHCLRSAPRTWPGRVSSNS